jgi:hypothetical protein
MKIELVRQLEGLVIWYDRLDKLRNAYPIRDMPGIATDIAEEMDKTLEEVEAIDDSITKTEEQAA